MTIQFQRHVAVGVGLLASTLVESVPWAAAGTTEPARLEAEHSAQFAPVFTLRFWPGEIELAGAIRDRAAEADLRHAVRKAQPGVKVWDVQLGYDPRAPELPPSKELTGLLLEMALSTRDGGLRVVEDTLVVSGKTDSLVTHAALATRLEQLSRDRFAEIRNEIQVVSSAELSAPSERRPISVLNPTPLAHFEAEISDEPYGPAVPVLRATPLAPGGAPVAESRDGEVIPSAEGAPAAASVGTARLDMPLGPLAPVRFDANSFLIDFNQHGVVREAASMIKALPQATKVTVLGFPDGGGDSTYHEWLATSRAKQVRDLLIEFGVPPDRLGIKSSSAGTRRQVQILIPQR